MKESNQDLKSDASSLMQAQMYRTKAPIPISAANKSQSATAAANSFKSIPIASNIYPSRVATLSARRMAVSVAHSCSAARPFDCASQRSYAPRFARSLSHLRAATCRFSLLMSMAQSCHGFSPRGVTCVITAHDAVR